MVEPDTPEHDKFRPYQEDAQTIGEFLEWMRSEGIQKMKWGTATTDTACVYSRAMDGSPRCYQGILYDTTLAGTRKEESGRECPKCEGHGYMEVSYEDWIPDGRTIEQLIADFFGIDKKKFDDETEAIYQYVSAMANPKL